MERSSLNPLIERDTTLITALIDHPLFLALVSASLALIFKIAYDRWLSRSSRVTWAVWDARNKIVDERFSTMLEHCKNSQAACSKSICDKITMNNLLFQKQMEGYSIRLNDGDEVFKSNRHYQKAVIITLLEMCNKMQIDCDKLMKVFVQEDLME